MSDTPGHNFTCALLCVMCGLPREKHQKPSGLPTKHRSCLPPFSEFRLAIALDHRKILGRRIDILARPGNK
jgi:hypothetical protein